MEREREREMTSAPSNILRELSERVREGPRARACVKEGGRDGGELSAPLSSVLRSPWLPRPFIARIRTNMSAREHAPAPWTRPCA